MAITTTTSNRQRSLAVRFLVGCGLLGAAMLLAGPIPQSVAKVFSRAPADNHPQADNQEEQRMREGTKVEKLAGYFKLTGDRVTFYAADEKQRFGGLENLALERIARTVKDSPTQLHWVVAGTVTEYRGSNFLLVTHAVIADEPKGYERQRPVVPK